MKALRGEASRPSAFARGFAELVPIMDARGAAAHRDELVAGVTGRVIEIGAGTGANAEHYGAGVERVLAIEPDPYLRSVAVTSVGRASVPYAVVAARAEHLPSPDRVFDSAVCSLVLCSVPDQAAALAEIRRVLRPGGRLYFYEHVRSASRLAGIAEDAVTPLWRRFAGGCHPNRDTRTAIGRAGFMLESVRRFGFSPARFTPAVAHIIGVARRP